MVAEAIAAVGLVGSIISIIDFSSKVIARLNEFKEQSTKLPKAFRSLGAQLTLLIKTLENVRIRAAAGSLDQATEKAFLSVLEKTRKDVEFVLNQLDEIRPTSTTSWDRAVGALKSLSAESRIKATSETIHQSINVITLQNSTTNVELSVDILDRVERLGRSPSPLALHSSNVAYMHQAAREGELSTLRDLLNVQVSVNVADELGRLPLHTASYHGQMDVVKFLLRYDAKIDAKDDDGRTALHLAVLQEHFEISRDLLTNGAALTIADSFGKSPEDYAKQDLLKLWAFRYGSGIDARDPESKNTVLIAAAVRGDSNLVRTVLQQGADFDAENRSHSTALIQASFRGYEEVVAVLLEYGADVNKVDASQYSALTRAIWVGRENIVKQLLKSGRVDIHAVTQWRHTAIVEAARSHHWTMMLELLEHGADANDADHQGVSCLIKAICHTQDSNLVSRLIDYGADITRRDPSGRNAMDWAVGLGSFSVMETLLACGADPNGKVNLYPYVNWLTFRKALWPTIKLLIDNGANVNLYNKDSWSALREAVFYGQIVQVRGLLSAGADVDDVRGSNGARMNEGGTLLMLAASTDQGKWHPTMVAELIAHGAKVDAQDSKGWTALRFAVEYGDDVTACTLLVHGADPVSKAHDGRTPVECAGRDPLRYTQFFALADTMGVP